MEGAEATAEAGRRAPDGEAFPGPAEAAGDGKGRSGLYGQNIIMI